ncbi:pentatricopeptide repeat-containing protein At1g11900-like [Phragmites australis]|uniref:pentatricopeptide repeat-containing protein At1g11900-like n=1 Tax=Phragmites australis TaxID=29695 RepID=UPI002D76D934|nr:pentatricopeptide repeat-containing protein At1g11900-like [Phragmites australis]
MWQFPPAVVLLLLQRSLASFVLLAPNIRTGPRCLMRALLIEERPTTHASSMTVRYLHNCGSADSDEDEAIEPFSQDCSTATASIDSDDSACTAHVEKLCRSGNLPDAVRVLRHLRDEQIHVSLHTFNMLLQHTAEANDFVLFSKVFRYLMLSKLPPELTSYIQVFKFVREILEITQGRDPTVMNRIIFAAAKYGEIDKSLIIFEELKKDRSSLGVVTFNTILDVLGKAGRVDQILLEVRVMEEHGHPPDIVTYNTVINCLRRLGRLDQCKIFAGEMSGRGITPDLRTYTALIDSFGRAGHIADALKMFDQMKKSHKPSIYVYRALISDLKKAGQFELAQKLSEEMNSSASDLLSPEDFKQKFKGRRTENKRLAPLEAVWSCTRVESNEADVNTSAMGSTTISIAAPPRLHARSVAAPADARDGAMKTSNPMSTEAKARRSSAAASRAGEKEGENAKCQSSTELNK